jgi:hypothetical protein
MNLKAWAVVANVASMTAAAVAAYLWFRSTKAKVLPEERPDGTGNPELTVDGILFVESTKLQSLWNKRAACAAALSALFQAVGLLCTSLSAS